MAEDEDEFLDALSTLEDVLADNGRRASLIKKRIAHLRRSRSKGASYTELVSGDDRLIVQLLTESSKALDTSGANVRRAEAQALHAEGMTMEQIANRFGVTRQRVSTASKTTARRTGSSPTRTARPQAAAPPVTGGTT